MENTSWKILPNGLGGESLYISSGADISGIPSSFQKIITDEHAAILANPSDYLSSLAKRSRLAGMQQWFTTMANANRCGLIIHTAVMPTGNVQTAIAIRGLLPSPKGYSDFLMASGLPVDHFPDALKSVYELIDGTSEAGGFASGGLDYPHNFDFSDYPLDDTSHLLNLDNALVFYTTDCGDVLCADGNKVFWFRHEDCRFIQVGDLEEIVASYFTSDLAGSEWVPDPYDID